MQYTYIYIYTHQKTPYEDGSEGLNIESGWVNQNPNNNSKYNNNKYVLKIQCLHVYIYTPLYILGLYVASGSKCENTGL